MKRPRLVVVGNAAVDLIFEVDRLPAAGETMLARASRSDIGGKGANQALVAARAGVPTMLVVPVGDDEAGRSVVTVLRDEGVDVRPDVAAGVPTDRSIVYIDRRGENCIVTAAMAAQGFTPDPAALRAFGRGDFLLMQGNLQGRATAGLLAAARARGLTTIVNAAPPDRAIVDAWPLVDHAILNEGEAAALSGVADPEAAAGRILAAGAGAVVVTLGGDGALVASGDRVARVPAPAVQVVDTAGAGDVFCGAFTAALAAGVAVDDGVRFAVGAAALSVTRKGTQASFPTGEELASMMELFGGGMSARDRKQSEEGTIS